MLNKLKILSSRRNVLSVVEKSMKTIVKVVTFYYYYYIIYSILLAKGSRFEAFRQNYRYKYNSNYRL